MIMTRSLPRGRFLVKDRVNVYVADGRIGGARIEVDQVDVW